MLPIRPATVADAQVLTEFRRVVRELGCENRSGQSAAMNRYAGHPLPAGRCAAPRTLSDHDEAPVPS